MRKYLKIFKLQLVNQILSYSIFKGDAILLIVSDTFGLIFSVIFFKALYSNIDSIGTWNYESTLLLVGIANFADSLYRLLFEKNVRRISALVRKGTLDYALIKPIDVQFFLCVGRFKFQTLSSLLFSILVIFHAMKLLQLRINVFNVIVFIILLITGVSLRYIFSLYSSIISFYTTRVSAFYSLQMEIFKYAEYPFDVFRGLIERIFFTFIFPIVMIANAPAIVIIQNRNYWLILSVFISVVHFYLSRILLFASINKYQSAGG